MRADRPRSTTSPSSGLMHPFGTSSSVLPCSCCRCRPALPFHSNFHYSSSVSRVHGTRLCLASDLSSAHNAYMAESSYKGRAAFCTFQQIVHSTRLESKLIEEQVDVGISQELDFRLLADTSIGAQDVLRGIHPVVDDLDILEIGVLDGQHRHLFKPRAPFNTGYMCFRDLQFVSACQLFCLSPSPYQCCQLRFPEAQVPPPLPSRV